MNLVKVKHIFKTWIGLNANFSNFSQFCTQFKSTTSKVLNSALSQEIFSQFLLHSWYCTNDFENTN